MALYHHTLAIVDDDPDVLLSAELLLKSYFEHIRCFDSPAKLIAALEREAITLVLLDMNYQSGKNDGEEGLDLLQLIKNNYTSTEVIVMTAYADVKLAVEAVKGGAVDFVIKPWQNEKLLVTIENTVQKREVELELAHKQAIINAAADELAPFIGESDAIEKIRELIVHVSPTPAAIHLIGESGTGKELVARHIHQHSACAEQAFIKVDFGRVDANDQEEQLFGTGANNVGKWELARGGTLYLDAITSMEPCVQEKVSTRVKEQTVENGVRLISSARSNVLQTSFRKDLYYQLNTIEVSIPPLRERIEDLYDLVEYFIEEFSRKYAKENIRISEKELDELAQYAWPGNVRELKSAVERAVIVCNKEISASDLIPVDTAKGRPGQNVKLERIEKEHIARILRKNNGNIQHSATDLGISRAALYRRIEKYDL